MNSSKLYLPQRFWRLWYIISKKRKNESISCLQNEIRKNGSKILIVRMDEIGDFIVSVKG